MTRRLGFLALLISLPAMCAGATLAQDGYIPSTDSLVIEKLPQVSASPLAAQGPEVVRPALDAAVEAARRMISAGQRSGDVRFYGYAQAQLAPWWEQARPPNAVLLLRAILRQAHHDFPAALTDLDLLLRRAPDNVQAWLSRAMILLVQGKPKAALSNCGHLIGKVEDMISAACVAAASPSAQTLQLLGETLQSRPGIAANVLVWARRIQAEAAERLGLGALAASAFREAMALEPTDAGLLAQYSAFLLREGKAESVIELLRGKVHSTTLLLRLTQAARLTGSQETGAYIERLKGHFAAEALRGEVLHLREAARAHLDLLGNPQRALELALENWSSQREIADAHLLLEAAAAAKQPKAAAPVLRWLGDQDIADVRLAALTAALREPRHARF